MEFGWNKCCRITESFFNGWEVSLRPIIIIHFVRDQNGYKKWLNCQVHIALLKWAQKITLRHWHAIHSFLWVLQFFNKWLLIYLIGLMLFPGFETFWWDSSRSRWCYPFSWELRCWSTPRKGHHCCLFRFNYYYELGLRYWFPKTSIYLCVISSSFDNKGSSQHELLPHFSVIKAWETKFPPR